MTWVYPANYAGTLIHQLAALADLNGLWATDIVSKAHSFYDGERWREQWVEALEGAGIDPQDVTMEDANDANAYNHARSRRLQQRLQERNRKILAIQDTVNDVAVNEIVRGVLDPCDWSGVSQPELKRKQIYGQPATALIRWMGAHKWPYAKAKTACENLCLDVADGTIRAQLSAGSKGKRGAPATLSDNQVTEVTTASESLTR